MEKEGKITLAEEYFETLQGRQHENKIFIGPSFLDLFYGEGVFKGIATPSGSGNASVAAWNDSIDLYCVKHTEQQQHLKWRGERQRSNRSQTHF